MSSEKSPWGQEALAGLSRGTESWTVKTRWNKLAMPRSAISSCGEDVHRRGEQDHRCVRWVQDPLGARMRVSKIM